MENEEVKSEVTASEEVETVTSDVTSSEPSSEVETPSAAVSPEEVA